MGLEGILDAVKGLDEFARTAVIKAAAAWWDVTNVTMTRSEEVECPVKTGALRSTGWNELTMTEDEIVCELGYGSEAVKYAFVQHENLAFHHNPPTKAKFLEDPIRQDAPQYPEWMKARLEGDMVVVMEKFEKKTPSGRGGD